MMKPTNGIVTKDNPESMMKLLDSTDSDVEKLNLSPLKGKKQKKKHTVKPMLHNANSSCTLWCFLKVFLTISVITALCLLSIVIIWMSGEMTELRDRLKSVVGDYQELIIPMTKIEIIKKDTYMCLASSVKDIDMDVVGYSITAKKDTVHHAVWGICEGVHSNSTLWDCRSQQGRICFGRAITFTGWDGWSRNHDVAMIGNDIGVRIGEETKLNTVIFQVHFKETTPKVELQSSNVANLTLILSEERHPWTMQRYSTSNYVYIPAKTIGFSSETACAWETIPVVAFRYFLHTHAYGKLVEAYVISNGTAQLIGRGEPHGKCHDVLPIIGGQANIYPGDIIATRCVYDNNGSTPVMYGMTASDEMCNFDLEFKYNARDGMVFPHTVRCNKDAQTSWWKDIFPKHYANTSM